MILSGLSSLLPGVLSVENYTEGTNLPVRLLSKPTVVMPNSTAVVLPTIFSGDLALVSEIAKLQTFVEAVVATAELTKVYNILVGSEVRLLDATGVEVSGGVESAITDTLTFSTPLTTTESEGRLIVMKDGYKYLSLPVKFGTGGSSLVLRQVALE